MQEKFLGIFKTLLENCSEKKIDERCKCLLVCLQSVGRKEQIVVKDILFGIKMNDPEKFYGIYFVKIYIFLHSTFEILQLTDFLRGH